jgi:hypothetical protein
MSTTAEPRRNREEVTRLGQEIFERCVKSNLKPEDVGKFVVIDINTEEYEIDADDYTAVMRLRGRMPNAEMWLMRAGYPAAHKLGLR